MNLSFPYFYLIISFTTSPAIINPATDGTNDTLPGMRFALLSNSFFIFMVDFVHSTVTPITS